MQGEVLIAFLEAIREDSRISPSHIALYLALFACCYRHDFQKWVPIRRREIMAAAKISGLATYHKCIRELDQYGYIRYHPSFHHQTCSAVVLVKPIATNLKEDNPGVCRFCEA